MLFEFLLIIFSLQGILSYIFPSPSLQPLQYIDYEIIGKLILDKFGGDLENVIFPSDIRSLGASVVTEGFSGFLSGLSVSIVAAFDGNKNISDTTMNFAGTSGIYFASRSGIETAGKILGMSTPLVDILAILFPALLSEIFKIRARSISEIQTRVGSGPKMFDLMKFERPRMRDLMRFRKLEQEKIGANKNRPENLSRKKTVSMPMSPTEVRADLFKWFTYSSIVSSGLESSAKPVQLPVVSRN